MIHCFIIFVIINSWLSFYKCFRLSIESQQTHHHTLVKEEPVNTIEVEAVEQDEDDDEEDEEGEVKNPVEVKPEEFDEEIPENKMPMSPSVEFLDDDEDEYEDDEDDKFNDAQMPHAPLPTRPPPTSISTIRLSQQDRVQ